MAHVPENITRANLTPEQLAHVEGIVTEYNFGRTIREIGNAGDYSYVKAILHWAAANGWDITWHPKTLDWINTP